MTAAEVILVGPGGVRGPHDVPDELASEALACIDDELALVGDRLVSVDALWSDVLASASGQGAGSVVLVCPTWWMQRRVERVRVAAERLRTSVTVLRRVDVLHGSDFHTVVEIAPDLVACHAPGVTATVVARYSATSSVPDAVLAAVGGAASLAIDVPARVTGAEALGDELAGRLRTRGIAVTIVDDDTVLVAARTAMTRRRRRTWRVPRFGPSRVAAAAGVVLSVTLTSAGLWQGGERAGQPRFDVVGRRADRRRGTRGLAHRTCRHGTGISEGSGGFAA